MSLVRVSYFALREGNLESFFHKKSLFYTDLFIFQYFIYRIYNLPAQLQSSKVFNIDCFFFFLLLDINLNLEVMSDRSFTWLTHLVCELEVITT